MGRDLLIMLIVIILTMSIVGCNMVKGAGKDMENAGESIQKTVDKNR